MQNQEKVAMSSVESIEAVENFSFSGSANRGRSNPLKKNVQKLLCRFWNVQVHSTAVILDFIVQLVDVVCKAQEQQLGFHLGLPAM